MPVRSMDGKADLGEPRSQPLFRFRFLFLALQSTDRPTDRPMYLPRLSIDIISLRSRLSSPWLGLHTHSKSPRAERCTDRLSRQTHILLERSLSGQKKGRQQQAHCLVDSLSRTFLPWNEARAVRRGTVSRGFHACLCRRSAHLSLEGANTGRRHGLLPADVVGKTGV